jgi:hypothetical protein
MDATIIDLNGNKRNFLFQYDTGQCLVINDFKHSTAPKIHFQIKTIDTAISKQSELYGDTVTCQIPDFLLTFGEDIIAYVYATDGDKEYVIETIFISVNPRKRPSNYIEVGDAPSKSEFNDLKTQVYAMSDFVLEMKNADAIYY